MSSKTSNSIPTSYQNDQGQIHDWIRVRIYQDEDVEQVHDLFMEGMAYGPKSPLNVALRVSLTQAPLMLSYATFALGVIIALRSNLRTIGILLSLASTAWFFWFRRRLSNGFLSYCKKSLKEDLSDIPRHYGLHKGTDGKLTANFPSGFWVAELCSGIDHGKSEIVGCVGLDMSTQTTHESTAELRRMVVSSSYRRRGVGRALANALTAHARQQNLSCVVLFTTSLQREALAMYKKCGWVVTSAVTRGTILFRVDMHTLRLDLTRE